jgi:hypothetical protein
MWVEWLLTFVLFLVAIWNCMLESLFEWLLTCGMFVVASWNYRLESWFELLLNIWHVYFHFMS